MTEKPHPAQARARLANAIVKRGFSLPAEHRSAPPMVTWRASECRCRVLSVYLTADGWVIDGEDFRVPMPEWIARVNPDGTAMAGDVAVTLDNYRAGRFAAFGAGEVSGVRQTLDLELDDWPTSATFEVGCNHGHGWRSLSELAEDCAQVRATRSPLPSPRLIRW